MSDSLRLHGLSMEFSRREYWNGQPFPSPGEPRSPALQADSLPAEPQGKPKNTEMGSLCLSPGDLPDPGIKPGSPAFAGRFFTNSAIREAQEIPLKIKKKKKMNTHAHTQCSGC